MLGLSPEEWQRLKYLQFEYNLRQSKMLEKMESFKPLSNDYTIKIEGYTTSNPRISDSEIWIDITPRWIKCSDRLPEFNEPVLCFDPNHTESKIYVVILEKENFYIVDNCECGNPQQWREASGESYFTWKPTHWMPLPLPPMEKAHQAEGSAKDSQSVDPDLSR